MLNHVIESIGKSGSNLSPELLSLHGFSSDRIRHLLNNLGQHPDLNYLEIGVHTGSTFVAANYGNQMRSVAIDNWHGVGLSLDPTEVRNGFLKNVEQYLPGQSPILMEQDSFTVKSLPWPINFYFYDGHHSEDSQYQSLAHFYPMLADTFVFCVDDWDWDETQRGTRRAIADLKIEVVREWEFLNGKETDPKGWWNGFYVSLLKK